MSIVNCGNCNTNIDTDFNTDHEEECEEVCEYCNGTGEVDKMEQVYDGEPHYAPTGTEKCECQY